MNNGECKVRVLNVKLNLFHLGQHLELPLGGLSDYDGVIREVCACIGG